MNKIEKTEIKACCGKTQLNFKVNFSCSKDHIDSFVKEGFILAKGFFDAGILYVEDSNLIIICTFGSNNFNLKCKSKACPDSIVKAENIILNLIT